VHPVHSPGFAYVLLRSISQVLTSVGYATIQLRRRAETCFQNSAMAAAPNVT